MSIEIAQTLDARGLNCPLPVLRTQKMIASMADGEVLEMTSTDPVSIKDIKSFCNQTGNELLSSSQSGGDFIFQIRKP